ncbi:helix-turn-helix domain-containing protein [Brucella pseudogrignonensis]|uniref:ArsR/SmtB family transcription factor n=1 Tax=Brucella pseudogrignonensis TaxID=419475 RepID=UPI00286CAB32|nr:helix-turn-helix domain-containing protein [Brucella pseudogrignonensis]
MAQNFLILTADDALPVLRGLASAARLEILKILHNQGPLNVNELADRLGQPQSSVSANISMLEEVGLIQTETRKARKGSQKICKVLHEEVMLVFNTEADKSGNDWIEVEMPVGLYTGFDVTAPCGMCSDEKIIGYLDNPDTFLNPERMKAGLVWFTRGYVDYQFPNNARIDGKNISELELVLELSSEVPGTSEEWPSDIDVFLNGVKLATWTSPGDFGDQRGKYTPDWWKLHGSQYGVLKSWRVTNAGTFIDGTRMSDVTIDDLGLKDHRSIRIRIGVSDTAKNPGGVNIFGREFGNYNQGIKLRVRT